MIRDNDFPKMSYREGTVNNNSSGLVEKMESKLFLKGIPRLLELIEQKVMQRRNTAGNQDFRVEGNCERGEIRLITTFRSESGVTSNVAAETNIRETKKLLDELDREALTFRDNRPNELVERNEVFSDPDRWRSALQDLASSLRVR